MLALIPSDYRYRLLGKSSMIKPAYQRLQERPGPPDIRAKLTSSVKSALIIHPLSESTLSMLASYLEPEARIRDLSQSLVPCLKRMLAESETIWEGNGRGVVLKCNEDIAVKIVKGNATQSNIEYASLTYLNKYAPDLPAPKPHGFIKLDNFCLLFMTLFRSTTLEKIWPSLGHENKVKIQGQLDTIFTRLRQLERTSFTGLALNTKDQTSIQEQFLFPKVDELGEPICQRGDLKFSVSRRASASWIKCLRGFLPTISTNRVLTHGDLWMANVMVDLDHNADYVVSGIIDWEKSGFYPEHIEASRILDCFDLHSESDWFAYLPDSISPKNYPIHWLVHRLWQVTVDFS